MGIVRTVKGEDGKPYISLEDLIIEMKDVKKSSVDKNYIEDGRPNFIDLVLVTLTQMEEEYYDKFLFKKRNNE